MEDAAFDARMNASAPAQNVGGNVFNAPVGMGGNQMTGLEDFNVDSYMEDTMYSPAPTPTRIPGLGDMGMGQNFRFMS
jgi:hypothetical protein